MADDAVPGASAGSSRQAEDVVRTCGTPDLLDVRAFQIACPWPVDHRELKYTFTQVVGGTTQVISDLEHDAVRSAFRTWSKVAPLTFTEVVRGDPFHRVDVRVTWTHEDVDRNLAGDVIAYADFPPSCAERDRSGPRPLRFDDHHAWSVEGAARAGDVESCALHEIGHILGLGHSTLDHAVMFRNLSDGAIKRRLTADDIAGIWRLYEPTVAFRSLNFPDRYIRHRRFLGELTPISSVLDDQDSSFRVRRGLADHNHFSLESVNYPDHFLRHKDFRIRLDRREDSHQFRQDATFILTEGFPFPGRDVALSAYNIGNHFIRHRGFALYLEPPAGTPFEDATFFPEVRL